MCRMRNFFCLFVLVAVLGIVSGMYLVAPPLAHAQAGLSTGMIQGTILDPNGAAVPGAKVTIASKATGAKITSAVSSTGTYTSGPLVPGEYVVRVEAKGFKALEMPATVQVGNITAGTVNPESGWEGTVVTVEASSMSVKTEKPTIQRVITEPQIEKLPIKRREFRA